MTSPQKSLKGKIFVNKLVGVVWVISSSVAASFIGNHKIMLLGIPGFIILFYALYLQFVEDKKKKND